jgi:hypothetical protein
MFGNSNSSFFARMGRKFFKRRLHWEIYHNVFPHVSRESDEGYPFADYADMEAHTESLDVQSLLADVERHVAQLPQAYGKCFRYIMHRDICERLKMFDEVAKRRAHPKTATVKALLLSHNG